jgi:DNA-binding PadR family transcriptional regulator
MMILGLVSWMQPVHGYDVRRELLSWHADEWANIQPGSIYHALKKLTDEGLLRAVGTAQVGARPARTSYEITSKGQEEFGSLLRRYWWEYRQPTDPFLAAFSFLPALPREEAAAALRNRARLLEATIETHRAALAADSSAGFRPVHVAWQFDRMIALAEAEKSWCERTARLVESGVSYLPETFDPNDAERWREWDKQTSSNNQT